MLDIKFILENQELMKQNIANRNMSADVDALISSYEKVKSLRGAVDDKRAEGNENAAKMKSATPEKRPALIEQGKQIKQDVADLNEKLQAEEEVFNAHMMTIPNIHADDIPVGKTDKENTQIKIVGEKPDFGFEPKDHLDLMRDLDLIDFESGAKVAGSKFYFLKNEAVLLDLALTRYAFDMAIKKGYTPLMTPDLARESVLEGIGFNPRGDESQIYKIDGMDLGLIATSEITVGGMLADQILSEEELPLKFVAFSHCFRREAGSAGQESKGFYRVHQFSKIELFQFTHPSMSHAAHEEIRELEEEIFESLGICFRTVDICTGDLGASAYKKYDLEAWMPGKQNDNGEMGDFGEITSTSNCLDFQSRRLKIRFKDKETGKNEFVHTLNGTAIALSRGPIALIEQYQQADGSVLIPEALRPYTGFDRIEVKKDKKKNAA
ncbi:MAG: serine--tRNA ligase [Rickettsiales bacterium]|nr:serine--tRNA ligase [Rickettsiales bacterium]|tara:strand:- start:276 stop:1589 length:1314 start_codon:yes stop_codon:yes gene_type:complete